MQPAEITGLYRYPVKGLTPEPLETVALRPGQTLPADRRYAIENGPSGFDPGRPGWLPKICFLMLQRDEWLAALQAHFDETHRRSDLARERRGGGQRQPRDRRGPRGDRAVLCRTPCRPDQGPTKGADEPRPQLLRRRRKGRLDHQSRKPRCHRDHGRLSRPSAALPRQCLCPGLAGLARGEPARRDARDRRARGSRSSSASPAAPPSTSIRSSRSATWKSRTR